LGNFGHRKIDGFKPTHSPGILALRSIRQLAIRLQLTDGLLGDLKGLSLELGCLGRQSLRLSSGAVSVVSS
jgi:hypothetical protein